MKVGLQINRFDWPGSPENIGSKLAEIARTADDAGFDSLWVMDHFFQITPLLGPVEDPMLEAYNTLGFLAGVTKRVRLGALVVGAIYREPALLVKAATTLDVLSGGRTYFGIGAGWYEREAVGLGFPFGTWKDRFERLEETLQIAKKMWSQDTTPYEGRHYTLAEPINSPEPLTKPHPPILVGGGGEKKTLRMVAQYADACNVFAQGDIREIVHKFAVLKQHCENLGRPYEEIERTVMGSAHLGPEAKTPKDVIAQCQELSEAGVEHVIFTMPNFYEITPLEVFGRKIIPAVAEL